MELRLKREADTRKREAAAAPRPERPLKSRENEKRPVEPSQAKENRVKIRRSDSEPRKKPDFDRPEPPFKTGEEFPPKEAIHKKPKKRLEKEEDKSVKAQKRVVKESTDDNLSVDEIKSQIKLEELKQKMQNQRHPKKGPSKKEKIAYKDDDGGLFSGVLASKLDEIVKKTDDKKDK